MLNVNAFSVQNRINQTVIALCLRRLSKTLSGLRGITIALNPSGQNQWPNCGLQAVNEEGHTPHGQQTLVVIYVVADLVDHRGHSF